MEKDVIKKKILEDVDPELRKKKIRRRRKDRALVALEFLGLIAVITLLFNILIGISTVQGNSMYPTLHDGDRVLYYRRYSDFKVGDIVALDRPDGEEFVKRVVAVAGDTVNIQGGKLYVNGDEEKLDGPIGRTDAAPEGTVVYPLTVGEDQVFVLGDNREVSSDSRMFGLVNVSDLKGRIAWYIGSL